MLELAILIILVLLSAFFSGVELAMMSLSRLKVRTLVKLKRPGAASLYRIKKDPHRLLITILIGNNLANIGAASLATVIATNSFGSVGAGVATGVMTFLILVFGEITPKTLAVQHGEKISLTVAKPLELLIFIFLPLVIFFECLTRFLGRFNPKSKKILTEKELRAIVSISKEEGVLDRETMEMIHSILDFEETKVSKILTPRRWLVMLDENLSIKEASRKIVHYPYDRFPIYRFNEDNVVVVILVLLMLGVSFYLSRYTNFYGLNKAGDSTPNDNSSSNGSGNITEPINQANSVAVQSDLRSIQTGLNAYLSENGSYPNSLIELGSSGYLTQGINVNSYSYQVCDFSNTSVLVYKKDGSIYPGFILGQSGVQNIQGNTQPTCP